jgi:hypothetical protein
VSVVASATRDVRRQRFDGRTCRGDDGRLPYDRWTDGQAWAVAVASELLVSEVVDFQNVSTTGLESSPVAEALAGLRANEARYFKNKYDHTFTVDAAGDATDTIDWVSGILKNERDIVIEARPLEATAFVAGGIRFAYVFSESGLSINVMYGLADGQKRAVGFKLSEGMPIPDELASRFKFAKQKSKLAGTIRGSFFVIKGEY